MVSATASKDKDGKIHISMSNIDADNAQEIIYQPAGCKGKESRW